MSRPCEISGQLQAKLWESIVREWVRRVGGDAAVAKFDLEGGVPEQNVSKMADELVQACSDAGYVPGMDDACQMDWAAWACFARWYVYLDLDVQEIVRTRIRAHQTDPWNDLASDLRLDDPTMKCDPSASASEIWCCPSNTYTDPYYTGLMEAKTQEKSFWEKAAPWALAIGGFGFGLLMVSAGERR